MDANFEASLQEPEHSESISKSVQNGKNEDCSRRETFREKREEGESRKNCSMQEGNLDK